MCLMIDRVVQSKRFTIDRLKNNYYENYKIINYIYNIISVFILTMILLLVNK